MRKDANATLRLKVAGDGPLGNLLDGGILFRGLPGADDAALARLEKNVADMDSVTTMLAKGPSLEDVCGLALKTKKMNYFLIFLLTNWEI